MRFATGYVADGVDHKRTPFGVFARRMGIASLPTSALVLASFLPSVLDQGQTGSCTGHATACAIATEFAARGEPLGFIPSPAEIYRNGRAIDRADVATLLTDDGAQPNQVYRAIEEFGVRAIGPMAPDGRNSDADPSTINTEPKWGDLEIESTSLLVGEYEIVTDGAQRIVDVQTALVAQRPITIAIAGGSDAFQGYTGGCSMRRSITTSCSTDTIPIRSRASRSSTAATRGEWDGASQATSDSARSALPSLAISLSRPSAAEGVRDAFRYLRHVRDRYAGVPTIASSRPSRRERRGTCTRA